MHTRVTVGGSVERNEEEGVSVVGRRSRASSTSRSLPMVRDLGYQVMLLGICISWTSRMHERGEEALSSVSRLARRERWEIRLRCIYRRVRRGRSQCAYRVLPNLIIPIFISVIFLILRSRVFPLIFANLKFRYQEI